MMATTAPLSTSMEDSRAAALKAQEYLAARLSSNTSTTNDASLPVAETVIPVIDLAPSFSSLLSDRRAVATQILHACTTTGFFYISGHGIPPSILDATLHLAHRFFQELSPASKDKLHMKQSKHFRGYEPAAYSNVSSVEGEKGKETKEAFNWGYESGLDPTGGDGKYVELDGTREGEGEKANLWPDEAELTGFYEGVKEYYGHALQLARHLFRLFALALDLPETYFDAMTTHPGAIARLIHYPPSPNPSPFPLPTTYPIHPSTTSTPQSQPPLGLGAHTDYECFTLLLQSPSIPALEILSPKSTHWIVAPPIPHTIVVNIGDFLMCWSGGKLKSTVHRVINRTGEERYSVPLFFSVNYEVGVERLPGCGDGEGEEGEMGFVDPFKGGSVAAGQYVLDRLALTVEG